MKTFIIILVLCVPCMAQYRGFSATKVISGGDGDSEFVNPDAHALLTLLEAGGKTGVLTSTITMTRRDTLSSGAGLIFYQGGKINNDAALLTVSGHIAASPYQQLFTNPDSVVFNTNSVPTVYTSWFRSHPDSATKAILSAARAVKDKNIEVFIPSGQWVLADSQVVFNNYDNLTITGVSGHSIVKLGPNTALGHIEAGGEYPGIFLFDNCQNIEVSNITFDFDGQFINPSGTTPNTGNGLRVQSIGGQSKNITVRNNKFYRATGHHYNIWISDADFVTVQDNEIIGRISGALSAVADSSHEGIEIVGDNINVSGNRISHLAGNGINIFGGTIKNIRVADNAIRHVKSNGIIFTWSSADLTESVVISNNNISWLGSYGISVTTQQSSSVGKNIQIIGNTIDSTLSNGGINVSGGNGSIVKGISVVSNSISHAKAFSNSGAINVTKASAVKIIGNTIDSTLQGNAIFVQDSRFVDVISNHIFETADCGILLDSAITSVTSNILVDGNYIENCGKTFGANVDTAKTSGIVSRADSVRFLYNIYHEKSGLTSRAQYGILHFGLDAESELIGNRSYRENRADIHDGTTTVDYDNVNIYPQGRIQDFSKSISSGVSKFILPTVDRTVYAELEDEGAIMIDTTTTYKESIVLYAKGNEFRVPTKWVETVHVGAPSSPDTTFAFKFPYDAQIDSMHTLLTNISGPTDSVRFRVLNGSSYRSGFFTLIQPGPVEDFYATASPTGKSYGSFTSGSNIPDNNFLWVVTNYLVGTPGRLTIIFFMRMTNVQ